MQKKVIQNSKIGWTEQEQNYLNILWKKQNKIDWKFISNEINTVFFQRQRTPKQCRQRFHNYIRYKGDQYQDLAWTAEEDGMLFKKYVQLGSKWAQISRSLLTRSENSVKNRFYGRMRKFIRQLNKLSKKSSLKNKRPIKQNTVTKILSRLNMSMSTPIKLSLIGDQSDMINWLEKLKYDIVKGLFHTGTQVDTQEHYLSIIQRIQQFALMTKTQNRKPKKIMRNKLCPLQKQLLNPTQLSDMKSLQQNNNHPQYQPIHEPRNESAISQFIKGIQQQFEEYFKRFRNCAELKEIDIVCGNNKSDLNFSAEESDLYS